MAKYFEELNIVRPAHLGSNHWELKKLNEITILFGKNGSGKSQLLRTLRNTDQSTYHYTSPERAGDITNDVGITQEQLTAPSRAARGQQNLSPTYRQESVSRIQALLIKIGNLTGRATASPVSLQELSTCLGGHALMGPLFNAPLLLVEGDDDNKIWSQVPRYHKVKLAVIPCNGAPEVKSYQKTLEKIFASLRTDQTSHVGYALLDDENLAGCRHS